MTILFSYDIQVKVNLVWKHRDQLRQCTIAATDCSPRFNSGEVNVQVTQPSSITQSEQRSEKQGRTLSTEPTLHQSLHRPSQSQEARGQPSREPPEQIIASNAMTRIQTISCFSVQEPGASLSPLAIHFECVQILVFC